MFALNPDVMTAETAIVPDPKTEELVARTRLSAQEDEFNFVYVKLPRRLARRIQDEAQTQEIVGFIYSFVPGDREFGLITREKK